MQEHSPQTLKPLYHGSNDSHEFYESDDHSLIVLRVHEEQGWTAHRQSRNGGILYVDGASDAAAAARILNATLAEDREWTKINGAYVLVPVVR